MRSVGIKALTNRLGEYVRLASEGEVVRICERDRVVAELRPVDPTRSPSPPDAHLAAAIREGLITPALQPLGPPPPVPGVAKLEALFEGLERDREDR